MTQLLRRNQLFAMLLEEIVHVILLAEILENCFFLFGFHLITQALKILLIIQIIFQLGKVPPSFSRLYFYKLQLNLLILLLDQIILILIRRILLEAPSGEDINWPGA